MKKIIAHISFILLSAILTGCYGYRQVGLLQDHRADGLAAAS